MGERGDERPVFARFEVRPSRTHAVLWVLILTATVADVVLTMVGTAAGLQEGNAVVSRMMAAFGPAGLWAVKFVAMCWLVAGWVLLSERNATVFLGLFAVVSGAVAVYNAVVVAASVL